MTEGCRAQPGEHEDASDAEGAVAHRRDTALASSSAQPAFRCLSVRKRAPHGLGGWAAGVSIRRTREIAALAARSPTAFFLAMAALLLCHTGQAGAKNADWPYVGNSRLLMVAGETIDTTMAASVLHGRANGRRGEFENASFAQYYVQLRPGVDPQEFHRAIGSAVKAYVPNNAYIVLSSGAKALEIAAMNGVQWVGKRPSRHKVSSSLVEEAAAPRKLKRPTGKRGASFRTRPVSLNTTRQQSSPLDQRQQTMEEWERTNTVSLHITVHTQADWDNAQQVSPWENEGADVGRDAKAFAARSSVELMAAGVSVLDTYRASDEKVVVRVTPSALKSALEWLSEQPEVMWVERKAHYYPLMSGAKRLIIDGPSKESAASDMPSISKHLGLDGSGQIIGVADSGLDWDSCFFWQSKNLKVGRYQRQGVAPPFQSVDQSRRKLISYNYYEDCKICDRCPLNIQGDGYQFATAMDNLEAGKDKRMKFPEDESLSNSPPRSYDSAGATVKLKLQAMTKGVMSEYLAQGAGAFEIPSVEIQVFIVPRAETENFIVPRVGDPNPDYSKCLNDCKEHRGNLVEEEQIVLEAAVGGYGVIIANRGFTSNVDPASVVTAHFNLKGSIQFKTALKPCGDRGDDRAGHGTHTTGVALGAVDTPDLPEFHKQRAAAMEYNGMAPGAKLYFDDVMQNDSPKCNVPGQSCARVNDMTVPLDLANDLFQKPYANGVRVHLNSWGCKPAKTGDKHDRPGQCNKYTTKARDIDKFVHDNPDFLVVFAAGESGREDAEGSIAEPGTCKNCLTVGSTHGWNKRYREAVLTRDPQVDICKACQFPYFCSRSDIIGGVVVADDPTGVKREEELKKLPKCCNDTISGTASQKPQYRRFEDVEVPEQEWFTFHFPDLGVLDPGLIPLIRSFKWVDKGAGIMYDFKASFKTIGTASVTEEKAGIQVFVLFRDDFAEYFEEGNEACSSAELLPENRAAGNCRANPCISSYEKQAAGSEKCMATTQCTVGGVLRPCYKRVNPCDSVTYDSLNGPLTWPDKHCHVGACKRLKEDESGLKSKDTSSDKGVWGKHAADGCPKDIDGKPTDTCCNDKFLSTMCINQPCTQISDRLSGLVRHKDITDLTRRGFGIAVRNMNDRPIKLTGTVEIRNKEYPCTLSECCGDVNDKQTYSECCSFMYPREFGAGEACDQCPAVPIPGKCEPHEVQNMPSWSTRGPGRTIYDKVYIQNKGSKTLKPELVAPSLLVVSANSDGFVPSVGEPDDLETQCGLPSQYVMTDPNRCLPLSAERFVNTTAIRAETGSSIAAALVAGSAAIIRQYLTDGYYPLGFKNQSNNKYANPSAALVKAMLINSARSVGGIVDTYTYKYPPYCDSTQQVCPAWSKPKPEDCPEDSSARTVDCNVRRDQNTKTPNFIQGYGRPELRNVIWSNYSLYSIWIHETFMPHGYQRSWSFTILKSSSGFPVKVTLVWTDAPGTPEAADILVNDLDLVVQLESSQPFYNPNIGVTTIVDVFEPYYGNDGARTGARDRSNVIEEVTIDDKKDLPFNMTVIVIGTRVPMGMESIMKGQNFAIVVTGQIQTKYETWDLMRKAVMDFVDQNDGNAPDEDERLQNSFSVLDTFKDGFARLDEFLIRIKAIEQSQAAKMIKEADDDGNGALDVEEWKRAVRISSSGARVPVEPKSRFGKADASLLQETNQATLDGASRAPMLAAQHALCLLICYASLCLAASHQ